MRYPNNTVAAAAATYEAIEKGQPAAPAWVIKSQDGWYLAERSRHRGCQAGYGRLITEREDYALRFASQLEAQEALEKEYCTNYERSRVGVVRLSA